MSVKERLLEYIKFKKISARQFSLSLGMSATYVASMRKSIQPDTLNSIAIQYPDLDTGWLMTGEGKMLKNTDKNDTPDISVESNPIDKEASLIRSIERMTETADRNSRVAEKNSETLSKLVDYLLGNGNMSEKGGTGSDQQPHTDPTRKHKEITGGY